jgi:hypothetical protein
MYTQVKYHEDFEKAKKVYTNVADTLETQRLIENQKNVSNIEYKNHGKNREQNPIVANSTVKSVVYRAGEKQMGKQNFSINLWCKINGYLFLFQDESNIGSKKIGSIADYDPMSIEYHTHSNGTSKKAVDNHSKHNASNNFTNTGSVRQSQLEKNHDDWNTVIRKIKIRKKRDHNVLLKFL